LKNQAVSPDYPGFFDLGADRVRNLEEDQNNVNVTENLLRSYLEIFHHELKNAAEKYLSSDARQRLLHLSYLPTKIVGYVSTRHGTAFEYIPNSATVIEIIRGSLPVEDLLVHPPNCLRHIGPMFNVAARRIGMFNITIPDAFPFRLTYNNGRELL